MWRCPTRVLIREGGIMEVASIIKQHQPHTLPANIRNILLVTDPGLASNTNIVQCIAKQFTQNNNNDNDIKLCIYDKTPANPRMSTIEDITRVSLENNSDLLISVGGGSAIDAGKCAAMYQTNMAASNHSLRSLLGANKFTEPPLPFIAIPSTCGTGAEITWGAVVADTDVQRKVTFKGDAMFPKIAIIDPDVLRTLPPQLIAATAMDAFTHAIESFTGTKHNPISDVFAVKAIDLLFDYLPRAVNKIKTDRFARYHIMLASMYAGLSFGSADVAGVHCISETLGAKYDIGHGTANAALLCKVFEYHLLNASENSIGNHGSNDNDIHERLGELCKAIRIEKKLMYNYLADEGMIRTDLKRHEIFMLCLNRLRSEIGNHLQCFNDFNISSVDFEDIAHESVLNGSNESNPGGSFTVDDYLSVLQMLTEDEIVYKKSPCHAHH